MPVLTRTELAFLLPHGGAMRLIDSVERWDDSSIFCQAESHRDVGNPLRHSGELPAVAAIEYAAQAIGIHVGLLNRHRQTERLTGYIGGLRDVVVSMQRLDDLPSDLCIHAVRLMEGDKSFMYRFDVTAGERTVMAGRASIFLKQTSA